MAPKLFPISNEDLTPRPLGSSIDHAIPETPIRAPIKYVDRIGSAISSILHSIGAAKLATEEARAKIVTPVPEGVR